MDFVCQYNTHDNMKIRIIIIIIICIVTVHNRRLKCGAVVAGERNDRITLEMQLAAHRGDPVFALCKRFRVCAIRISLQWTGRVCDSDTRVNVKGHALERAPLQC